MKTSQFQKCHFLFEKSNFVTEKFQFSSNGLLVSNYQMHTHLFKIGELNHQLIDKNF